MFRASAATSAPGPARATGVRASAYLLVFALLPLAFAGWVGTTSIGGLRRTEQRTARIRPAVDEYVTLNALRSELTHERYFFGAAAAVAQLGVDPAAVRDIVGIDIAAELRDAHDAVDRLLGEVGDDDTRALVVRARLDESAALASATGFDDAVDSVGRRAQRLDG